MTEQSSPQTRPWMLLLAFTVGGFILLCFCIMRCLYVWDASVLLKRGAKIEAAVTISGMFKEDCYYTFTVDGTEYKGRGPEKLSAGDTLAVSYDPSSPKRNRPVDGLWKDVTVFPLAMFGVIVAGIIGYFRRSNLPKTAFKHPG